MTYNFVCVFILAACLHVALSAVDSDGDYEGSSIQARTVGRAYSLSSCNYKLQVGYSCLTCNRALHCYPGDIAILVDCYGMFRFCRDGRCSRHQGEKCLIDTKLTTPGPANDTIFVQSTATENIVAGSVATKHATEIVTEKLTEAGTKKVEAVAGKLAENIHVSNAESISDTNARGVTETVIIPIDDTTTTKGDVLPTNSDDSSNNLV